MKLVSDAFENGAELPRRYTCEGENVSPPLSFVDIPKNTSSLALIVDDPDAPDPKAPQRRWVHWVLYNLPPTTLGLKEAVSGAELPLGTHLGLNDWRKQSYGGPCPPIGRHRYFHTLYALDIALPQSREPLTREQLLEAMGDHLLAKAELLATYEKQSRR